MKTIRNFLQDVRAFFCEYPEYLVAILLSVVAATLWFAFVDLPNIQECQAHGFTLRFCVTQLK
jgi:hypothetical protein